MIHLIRAEWTKFRSIRGWVIGTAFAMLALILIGLLSAEGSHTVAAGPHGGPRRVLLGPDGEPVQDDSMFVHQTLTGDGAITVRLSSLTGSDSLNPWAKAGLMIKRSTLPGSAYAAVMLTGRHGVRMQFNFTGDIAGGSGIPATPRWLRLVRAGSTFTGYASTDGTAWSKVGATQLHGMPPTVEAGMFVTSPADQTYEQHIGSTFGNSSPTRATGVFDNVSIQGSASGAWRDDAIGGTQATAGRSGDTFTLTGSGNIAPNSPDGPGSVERTLVGTFAGLTALIVLAILFITSEYRRGMIRTSFAASPARSRVLVAKAAVIGAVAFGTGLIASAIALPLCNYVLKKNGNLIFATSSGTKFRLIVGTALVLALASVFALAVGTLLRRSVGAVAAVIALIVLPYLLSTAAILPAGPANWLLRITPAAAFAIQQSVKAYLQVDSVYTPATGYFPLSPWGGFAVLCVWTTAALGVAIYAVRRRDV